MGFWPPAAPAALFRTNPYQGFSRGFIPALHSYTRYNYARPQGCRICR